MGSRYSGGLEMTGEEPANLSPAAAQDGFYLASPVLGPASEETYCFAKLGLLHNFGCLFER
jgi:hypothetical protein